MRILVTNDDGIESEGIHALVRALAATDHEVVVVAPDRNWSGRRWRSPGRLRWRPTRSPDRRR